MAYVYKPTRADPLTGERVKYKCWYIRYRDADGTLREVIGLRGRAATLAKALELEGRIHPPLRLPLSKHIEDFRRSLPKGEAAMTVPRLRAVLDGCGFYGVTEIRAARVTDWLREDRRRTAASRSHALRVVRSFTAWLLREGRLANDPLANL